MHKAQIFTHRINRYAIKNVMGSQLGVKYLNGPLVQ